MRASDSRSARSSMRFMTSSSSTASTWAETPWCSSPTPPIQCRWYAARSENSQVREALVPTNGDHAQPQGTAAEHDTNQRRGRGPPIGNPGLVLQAQRVAHLYRSTTPVLVAEIGITAPTCQARDLLTAIAPAPRSARIPAVPPRIAASLPVFASPWEGAGLLRTGVTGAVGVTPAGV